MILHHFLAWPQKLGASPGYCAKPLWHETLRVGRSYRSLFVVCGPGANAVPMGSAMAVRVLPSRTRSTIPAMSVDSLVQCHPRVPNRAIPVAWAGFRAGHR
jgi:hypothetical protein